MVRISVLMNIAISLPILASVTHQPLRDTLGSTYGGAAACVSAKWGGHVFCLHLSYIFFTALMCFARRQDPLQLETDGSIPRTYSLTAIHASAAAVTDAKRGDLTRVSADAARVASGPFRSCLSLHRPGAIHAIERGLD
ncbi:hypothetical protein MVEN_00870600 [Mycena venus]|uniref:Secreted protein n=1 Tax=Mycena venus TaxID=2733690 RepID=A0A8H6YH90_9AGAR|nr:hypothetical protein MVEN_00870600 [Mycena venus]